MAMQKNDKMTKAAIKAEQVLADMTDSRIITKNLVYVIGLSGKIATKETLLKKEFFGQYGNITKIVVNNNKAYNQNNPKGPSYSAYVTYSKPYEASIAILSLDNIVVDEHLIRASFGTTKYCSFYLKKIECSNKDCLFLHKIADPNDIISRDDLNGNKNIFMEQQLYAMRIADIYSPEIKKKILRCHSNSDTSSITVNDNLIKNFQNKNTVLLGTKINTQNCVQNNHPYSHENFKNKSKAKLSFPLPEKIYEKQVVKENDPILSKNKNVTSNTKKKYIEDGVISVYSVDNLNQNIASVNISNKGKNFNSDKKTQLLVDFAKSELNNENDKYIKNIQSIKNILSPNESTNNLNEKLNDAIGIAKNNQQMHCSISTNNDTTSISSKEDNFNFSNEEKNSEINLDLKKSDLDLLISQNTHKLYTIRENSRFSFVAENGGNKEKNFVSSIEIPNFIQTIITKKSETFLLSRNIKHIEDVFYSDKNLEFEFKKNNHWAQFILENKVDIFKDRADKELIEDFDYINNLVLNKFKKKV